MPHFTNRISAELWGLERLRIHHIKQASSIGRMRDGETVVMGGLIQNSAGGPSVAADRTATVFGSMEFK